MRPRGQNKSFTKVYCSAGVISGPSPPMVTIWYKYINRHAHARAAPYTTGKCPAVLQNRPTSTSPAYRDT